MRIHAPVLAPLLACALLAGCSSSGDDSPEAAAGSPSPSSAAVKPTSSVAAARPGTSAVPTAGASVSPAPLPSASASPPSGAAAVRGTAPGDYTYDTRGTYALGGAPQRADGTATLTVTPLRDGRQTTTLRSEHGGDTVQDLVVRADGVHLARLAVGAPVDEEFRPTPPVLLFPTPAAVGRTWAWRATSTDRSSTVRTTNEVVRTETLTIGGRRVGTVVLQTRLVISGQVSYTADVTTWVATAQRLPVKDRTRGTGTWGQLRFSTDTTSVLRSVRPS